MADAVQISHSRALKPQFRERVPVPLAQSAQD
jgi:hypothetical protein